MKDKQYHDAKALFDCVQGEVALAAIRKELTIVKPDKKCDIHPTMIGGWKRTAIANMAAAFGDPGLLAPKISEKGVEKLHGKIGQFVIERFLFVGSLLSHSCCWGQMA
ncbi:hypothetical protein GCM10019059_43100 [Camelimonas fluminis]|uniref:Uncharacterized protein n=1 Tax=Camelimonas fluminis TaxID=1576911 RepID=A0ABV7UMY3_9HYPH|nr:hypothetical protein [Camelimonas fluminis]GHE80118.1 hypothetical protein GCM10019059_43100 [Camelimonas fluminis]